jgi:hypothetical protein
MEEWAAITEFAFTFSHEIFAWLSLVVRVDSSEGSFTKILWKRLY